MFENEDEQVSVAAGIVMNNGKVLICKRPVNRRYGLKWEFPGGKAYPGEPMSECLKRELMEELDIEPTRFSPLRTLHAEYPDGGRFLLTFFIVREYEGEVHNNVFEDIAWVTPEEIASYDLLEGSRPILQHLRERLHKA